ncbi:DUF4214 domain-containing protein [Salipiger sp. PrR002]|uniref:DUF4214 domain-containing protein n=1 Tax=Salipiger sp. PrR002 TaxID=2706489 RepID=UPI0013BCBFAC|nr:DUF4214 domain-containing protein [Salipiger sp. PrR002]NDW01325.1 DUF4214 domain-containing protein [Salipiger sp. PrR002]NDW58886.1 DUF4214 domain-containing protein [Salipiger sp. PrR004]
MVQLRHMATRLDGPQTHMTSVSGLLTVVSEGGVLRLYSASGAGGGLLARGSDLALQDAAHYGAGAGLDAPRWLEQLQMGGADLLLAPGRYGSTLEGWEISANGDLSEQNLSLRMQGAAPQALLALDHLSISGQDFVITAGRQSAGVHIWRLEGETLVAQPRDVQAQTPGQVSAIEVVGEGAQSRVLALSAEKNSLYSYAISTEGQLSDVQRLDLQDGLFLDRPTVLKTVDLAGQTYALVGAANGVIAVVALGAGGRMQLTDLIGDDLQTRFAGVTALETVSWGGQIYVVAGGSDDGLSLMTLLPGGRLLHVDTLADDAVMALSNPAALALTADAEGLDIYVAGTAPESAGGSGISRIRVDLGQEGNTIGPAGAAQNLAGSAGRDQIHGAGGNDTLSGGAGDDVLIDGPGQDRLSGGSGADVFVFTADGQTDRITDFERGIDRLDLSDLGRFYTVEALDIQSTARGARIVVNREVTQVDSADGRPLNAGDFDISDLRDLWHIDSSAIPAAPLSISGTGGADLLQGREAADTLEGGPGADILRGGEGNDLLIGEAPDPVFDPVSGQVFRLYQATLDRAPDLQGLVNWSARLISGERELASVAAGFTNSAEFRKTYGALDDRGFVTQLYNNVLDRDPDAGGLAGWTARLEAGMSRAQVVLGFSESAEFKAGTAAAANAFSLGGLQQGWSDDVFRLYQATLDRAPDLGGLLGWSGRLAEGQAYLGVVNGFVQSAEFQNTYGTLGHAGFVAQLYRNVLDREGDAAGLENWTGRLEGGMSRAEVVRGFAQSAEFVAATAPDLLAWMRDTGADDLLEGGAGHNLLVGGLLSDCFSFHAGEAGEHDIAGLERWDLLRFEGFGYTEAADVRAHLVQDDNAMVFSDQGTRVILHGVDQSDIHDDMFLF